METYFNYFTEIEEHFQRRRGTLLLLSPLDWALMETWKDAGIPLEAVLRGIDATFEKWERRPSRFRKVNGLAYCSQEVLASVEETEGSRRGRGPKRAEGLGTRPVCRGGVPESQRRATRCGAIAGDCANAGARDRVDPAQLWRIRCRRIACCPWKTWSDD